MAKKKSKKQQFDKVVNHGDLIKIYRDALVSGVPLEKVRKKAEKLASRAIVTEEIENFDDTVHAQKLKRKLPRFVRVGAAMVPILFFVLGLGLMGSAVVPITSYYITTLPNMRANDLQSPIPKEQVLDVSPLIISQAHADTFSETEEEEDDDSGPIIIDAALDYTNLSNWFDNTDLPAFQVDDANGEYSEYTIDIPKLDVTNAVVSIGGTNLNKGLIQYPGTSHPGKDGAPVIFGHSILRQFYNPDESNPRRYKSIFSYIMTLEKGDKIYVNYGNTKYTYMVQDKSEVKPTDVYILSQQYDAKRLKLVTCTPEGLTLRRGVITAQLIKE